MPNTEFLDMLTDRVSIHPYTGRNAYGEATYGAATTNVPAYVQYSTVVEGSNRFSSGTAVGSAREGVSLTSKDNAVVDGNTIEPLDQIELPDGSRRDIASVSLLRDDAGPLQRVWFA